MGTIWRFFLSEVAGDISHYMQSTIDRPQPSPTHLGFISRKINFEVKCLLSSLYHRRNQSLCILFHQCGSVVRIQTM